MRDSRSGTLSCTHTALPSASSICSTTRKRTARRQRCCRQLRKRTLGLQDDALTTLPSLARRIVQHDIASVQDETCCPSCSDHPAPHERDFAFPLKPCFLFHLGLRIFLQTLYDTFDFDTFDTFFGTLLGILLGALFRSFCVLCCALLRSLFRHHTFSLEKRPCQEALC